MGQTSKVRSLKIGCMGAANIAPTALIKPASELPEVEILAVAARDPARATEFAKKHRILKTHTSYQALIHDAEIDAVYIPLPNSLHCEWTLKALNAGKHVLCEKPIASNAAEAERMLKTAEDTGLVLMEAFHYRYHPLATRMKEIVDSGELGRVSHIEAKLCFPLLNRGDIRYSWPLSGGALMDAGCYPINIVRYLAGAEPEVVSAQAKLMSDKVDRAMTAEFRFADGRTGRVHCSMLSRSLLGIGAKVVGDQGKMHVLNPIVPQLYHRLTVKGTGGKRVEKHPSEATYTHQLRAFARAIRQGSQVLTHARDAVSNMRVIDSIYQAAGLPIRASE